MREILFRGKQPFSGKWVEGFYVHIPWGRGGADEHLIQTIKPDGRIDAFYPVNPNTVGQFTGLRDKNGKKIFEGDIVKHYNRVDKDGNNILDDEGYVKGLIYFDTSKARYKRTSSPEDVFIGEHCRYEVIGNIHDNPELLNKES